MMKKAQYKYPEELTIAKRNLTDLHERGTDAIGESWEEVRRELFTPEELAASELRVAHVVEHSNMSMKMYEDRMGINDVYGKLAEAEEDITTGRVSDARESLRKLREKHELKAEDD